MANSSIIIGIDAGGTKTRVVVGNQQQFRSGKIQQHEFGSANFREIGEVGLRKLLREITNHFRIAEPADVRVIAGFAGVGTEEARGKVSEVFRQEKFTDGNVTITSDFGLILAALKNIGIVLIAGTGGICVGRNGGIDIQSQDGLVRAGGYGYRIDSEAGGYYLGRRAIDIALKLKDGRNQEPSILYDVVKEGLGIKDLRKIAEVIYPGLESGKDVQAKIASLAPMVLEAAANGDKVAADIVAGFLSEMADHVQAVCSRLKLDSAVVALHGGIFKSRFGESLVIQGLRKHPYLSPLNLSYMTVGVAPGDLDILIEAVKFVKDCEQQVV